jgi:hypothetical protein
MKDKKEGMEKLVGRTRYLQSGFMSVILSDVRDEKYRPLNCPSIWRSEEARRTEVEVLGTRWMWNLAVQAMAAVASNELQPCKDGTTQPVTVNTNQSSREAQHSRSTILGLDTCGCFIWYY